MREKAKHAFIHTSAAENRPVLCNNAKLGIEHPLSDLSGRRSKPCLEKQQVSEISGGQPAANRQFAAAARQIT